MKYLLMSFKILKYFFGDTFNADLSLQIRKIHTIHKFLFINLILIPLKYIVKDFLKEYLRSQFKKNHNSKIDRNEKNIFQGR